MSALTGTNRLNSYLQEQDRMSSLSWVESWAGPAHAKTFTCICKIDGKTVGEGQSPKKHIAKDLAADIAWGHLTVEASGSSS